jgi:hypothetical protein
VANRYVIEATHTYAGTPGTVFTARLTIQDINTGETGSKAYYLLLQDKTLDAEVNAAIDEGLWELHKSQRRFVEGGAEVGDWATWSWAHGLTAANLNAFEVNGHLANGDPANPYTETTQRALRRLFQYLGVRALPLQTNGLGTFNPDANGNGLGIYVAQGYYFYQGGMFMDAIVASGTPNAIATTGGTNINGRTFKEIVQDMVDDHAWAQYDYSPGGGWRYNSNEYPDNSACQWAVVGMLAAERNWGCTIPAIVKQWNVPWLAATQHATGQFGYTDPNPVWGPYATTPSGMVQMVMDGIGRGMTGPNGAPSWDKAETFLRNNFGNTGGSYYAIKDYYYGLFSFVKSMLLYPYDGDEDPATPDPTPIRLLRSSSPGVTPLDWYSAEVSKGAPTDGVARTLVDDQRADGIWWNNNNITGDQWPFETAWAIMMLHRTVFESGVPVAVAKAIPNPAVAGAPITLDGSDSYHQDAGKHIDSWQWDSDSDGVFDATGPFVTVSFPAIGSFPVKLRVTDDSSPERFAETTMMVQVTIPPLPPTADAAGPYVFCERAKPWFLNGLGSINPDEGRSEPHAPPYPGDTIQEYAWDLDDDGAFDDAFGPTPDVTAFFAAHAAGSYLIRLRVTDTTSVSYPSSQFGDLSGATTAQVIIGDAEICACIDDLRIEPVVKALLLTWTSLAGAEHYAIYRGNVSGGPYLKIGEAPGDTPVYLDEEIGALDQDYFYVVRPALANGNELCQSNEVVGEALHPAPGVSVVPKVMSNLAKYYYTVTASSPCFGSMQLQIYIGDTGSSMVAGPFPNKNVFYIRTGQASATTRTGNATVKAYIMTKGSARVWAFDPIGQTSTEVIVP